MMLSRLRILGTNTLVPDQHCLGIHSKKVYLHPHAFVRVHVGRLGLFDLQLSQWLSPRFFPIRNGQP